MLSLSLHYAGKSPWGRWKLLFISQNKKAMSLVCRPRGYEKDVARSCWQADLCPNRRRVYWKSWRILYSYVHAPRQSSVLTVLRLTGLWLLPSHCYWNKRAVVHTRTRTHTYTLSKKWKNTQIVMGGIYQVPSYSLFYIKKKKNLLCTACVIHQQVR